MRNPRGHIWTTVASTCCIVAILFVGGCDLSDSPVADSVADHGADRRLASAPQANHIKTEGTETEGPLTGSQSKEINRFSDTDSVGKTELQESMKQAAVAAMHQGKLKQAERMFQALMRQDPEDPLLMRYAAQAANYRGNRADGNRYLRLASRLVILNQDEMRGLMNPLESYLEIGSEIDSGAVHESPVALNLIRELAQRGDLASAIDLLYRGDNEDPATMTLLGRYLLLSQRYEELKSWFESRGAGWSRYPDFWFAVGGLARCQNEFDAAAQAFSMTVGMEPYDRSAVIQLSACLQASGHFESSAFFRDRYEVIKELQELTNDLVCNRNLPRRLFEIAERELVRIGQPIDAHGWRAIGKGIRGTSSSGYQQAIRDRSAAVAAYASGEAQRARLPGFEIRSNDAVLQVVNRGLTQTRHLGTQGEPDQDADEMVSTRLTSQADGTLQTDGIAAVGEAAQAVFVNVAAEAKLQFQYLNAEQPVSKHFLLHQALGAGVACFDFDNDANVDLYFAQGGCDPPSGQSVHSNLLARNLGGQFQTVTQNANADDRGYSTALTVGDWNQDGFLDLVVGNLGVNHLLINQGDGTFQRLLAEANTAEPNTAELNTVGKSLESRQGRYTMGLAMADVSGDGLPDLVEANYTNDPRIFLPIQFNANGDPVRLPGPLQFRAAANRMFIVGAAGAIGQPRELTSQSNRGYSLGLLVTNFDGQAGNEIFVGNDQTANHLWTRSVHKDNAHSDNDVKRHASESDVHWVNRATVAGLAYGNDGSPMACMGIAAADFDHNGLLDLHVSNFYQEWSNHYLQLSSGHFIDQALRVGFDQPTYPMLGFGAQALDWANNGIPDLVIGNGHLEDFRASQTPFAMPTQLFASDGSSMKLHAVAGDDAYWKSNHLTRAVATLDWNNDGRIDFVTTDLMEPAALLENRTESFNHHLKLRLIGTESARDSVGAVVSVTLPDGSKSYHWVCSGDGYLCKNEPVIHIGMGQHRHATEVLVTWPNQIQQRWQAIESDQSLLAVQGQDDLFAY